MAYRRTGNHQDRPLILLHGFQASGLAWLRTAKALGSNFDVIMPDFRGHGDSSANVKDFSLDRLSEDIVDLIKSLGLGKVYIVGHSMGAEIAGRVAGSHPDLVRAVILVEPAMRSFSAPTSGPASEWYQHWLATMKTLKEQSHEERLITALQMLPPPGRAPGEEDYVPMVEAMAQFNLEVLNRAAVLDYRIATQELAGQITAPLLLITGNPQRGSVATPEGIAAIMESGREAVTFENAGHFIPVEQFDRFIAALQSFLNAH